MANSSQGDARGKVKGLIAAREAVESEIAAIQQALEAPGMPGLTGSLVDKDGFPRADVDVYSIRQQRSRFAKLQTDYTSLSDRIEKALHQILAPGKEVSQQPQNERNANKAIAQSSAGQSLPPTVKPNQSVDLDALKPFALVDRVDDLSPAYVAGLREGDMVLDFAGINLQTYSQSDAMQALRGVVNDNIDNALPIGIARTSESAPSSAERLRVSLVPRRWNGPGLLGCHLVPRR